MNILVKVGLYILNQKFIRRNLTVWNELFILPSSQSYSFIDLFVYHDAAISLITGQIVELTCQKNSLDFHNSEESSDFHLLIQHAPCF